MFRYIEKYVHTPFRRSSQGPLRSTAEVSATRCSGSLNYGREVSLLRVAHEGPLWRGPGPAESVEEEVGEVEVFRPAAWEEGTWWEAWPEKPLNSESGGSGGCWRGVGAEEVEGGSETGGCQLQEGPAVRFSVPVEVVAAAGRCLALTGAVAC